MSDRADVLVVGAGILGLAVARELLLRHSGISLIVLERAADVGADQSTHNSGVIHAGVYYKPGSLKARLCVAGAARLYEYCEAHGIQARRIGKLIVARSAQELPALEEIDRRARANGVRGIRRLDGDEIRELEPHVAGIAALHSPDSGIVDFGAVSQSLAADVQDRGGQLRKRWQVVGVAEQARGVRLRGADGEAAEGSAAVFCAGLWADRLAVAAGAPPDPRIVPFRGAYLRLAPERRELVRGLVYPVPDPALPFLGVHLTPRIDGEVLVGPTALLVGARDAYRLGQVRVRDLAETLAWPGTWRMAARWWRTGLHEIRMAADRRAFAAEAASYVPELRSSDLLPAFAGVRAQAVGRSGALVDDFVLSSTSRTVHVRNAPSPAATSSLALAELIVDRVEKHLL